jgi:predicted hydrocarbon binding protein
MILLINKKNIFFMDEEVFKSCVVYYKLKENNLCREILRLPIVINNDISSASRREVVNILTIARFDFPFKAYTLGLIDAFQEIVNFLPNITLTIIGYGEGESLIKQKIMELKKEVKEKITVINKVAYSEIDHYIDKCDVYVGMGTTILDAVNRNKITISAVGYQLCDLATGFFFEDYRKLGEIYCDKKSQSYSRFSDLLEWVCSIDDDTFIEIENYSKSLLSSFYNIDKIAPQLAGKSHKFSFMENVLVKIMSAIYTEEMLSFILCVKKNFKRL